MTFDRQGPQNTEATLKLAMEAAGRRESTRS